MGPDGLYGPGVLDDEDTYEEAGYAMWLKVRRLLLPTEHSYGGR